jgi:hypothetical protein
MDNNNNNNNSYSRKQKKQKATQAWFSSPGPESVQENAQNMVGIDKLYIICSAMRK